MQLKKSFIYLFSHKDQCKLITFVAYINSMLRSLWKILHKINIMPNATLKHVVFWKIKETPEKNTNLIRFQKLLNECRDIVPGILRFEVEISQKGLESTYDIVLNSEFISSEALKAYQNHPQHVSIKPLIRTIQESRQCMDYMS